MFNNRFARGLVKFSTVQHSLGELLKQFRQGGIADFFYVTQANINCLCLAGVNRTDYAMIRSDIIKRHRLVVQDEFGNLKWQPSGT